MLNFAEQIADALDILKFDGAVQDTLAELRGKWGAQVPALLDERFDAVGVQYMKLSHEKGAAALGQELSAFGWALYNLDDEDEYLFALIPEEERSEWERYCKKQGQYCHLMKQQGRKWGDHAKEQDPGKLMPCEEYILQDSSVLLRFPASHPVSFGTLGIIKVSPLALQGCQPLCKPAASYCGKFFRVGDTHSRPLCHTFRAFRHKQDSTLVAEQTTIFSVSIFLRVNI